MNKKIVTIIPARAGSKGLPKKNIRLIRGHPLIAYSIIASKLVEGIDRTIVSTDSLEIANIAKQYGAEVPFMRPDAISGDNSLDIEFLEHFVSWYKENEGELPDYIVQLRPTTPLRDPKIIEGAIEHILQYPEASSLRSVHSIEECPYKCFTIEKDYLEGLFPGDKRKEYHNLPRQVFPKTYHGNGYIDIIKTETILQGLVYGRMLAWVTSSNTLDIDTMEHLNETRKQANSSLIYKHLKENIK